MEGEISKAQGLVGESRERSDLLRIPGGPPKAYIHEQQDRTFNKQIKRCGRKSCDADRTSLERSKLTAAKFSKLGNVYLGRKDLDNLFKIEL